MLHINLETCVSTQSYLKEKLQTDPPLINQDLLITTEFQEGGIGRGPNKWIHFEGAISMSCLLPTISPLTTAPLQAGLLLTKFFRSHFNKEVYLKWPNDLMTKEGKKVGGIICQLEQNKIIAGIGINLFKDESHHKMPFICDGLNLKKENITSSKLAADIYKYLINHFQTPFSTREWSSFCYHLNKTVKITDEFDTELGTFTGISPNGEAILNQNGVTKKILTGSLFLI